MRVSKFLVLLPIFLAALACFYSGVLYFDNFRISYGINSEVKRESLVRSAAASIISERKAYERYSQTRSPQDEITLRKADAAKNLAVKIFLNSLSNTSDDTRMRDRLNDVLKNANASWESFNLSFYSFVELANSAVTSGQVVFKDVALDIDIKRYILSLIRTYELLQNVNIAKEHILAVLMGKEKITESSLKQTINSLKHNDINANLLPSGEIKDSIIRDIDRLDNIETTQGYDEIRFKLKLNNELTRDEILQINNFENKRADLFGKIANVLSDELKRQNDNFRIKVLSLIFLMFFLSLWLFYAGYKTYIWLKALENLNQKMRLVRNEIFKRGDRNPQKLIENFIALYKELLQKYEQERSFTAIKDRLLVRLNKKFYQAKEQIFSSVATLKKDENVVKNELLFENLEKNSQIIAINYSNIKGLLDSRNGEVGLNLKPFNPQILFSNILETQIPFTQEKKLNFLTYLDANISDELEGDSEKINIIFNMIMLAITTKCDRFANLSVEIRNASNYAATSGITSVNFKITINQMCFSSEQIDALQLDDKNEIIDEDSEFYLRMARFYLSLLNTPLDISTLGGTGNEFNFTINLKNIKKLQNFDIDVKLKIGYIPDINTKYNDFFERTLESMRLKFKNVISYHSNQAKSCDIVFTRQTINKKASIENVVSLKEPLTPLNIARLIYTQKYQGTSLYEKDTTFLLCDENPLSIEMIKHIFNYFDCEVVCIGNKKELKQALLINHFDAIFIDASFFENNASKYVKELRSLRDEKQILIAMTSNTKNISERELVSPFDEMIKKPFSKNELKRVLSKFEIDLKPNNENTNQEDENKTANNNATNTLEEIKNTIKEKEDFREFLRKIKKDPISI